MASNIIAFPIQRVKRPALPVPANDNGWPMPPVAVARRVAA